MTDEESDVRRVEISPGHSRVLGVRTPKKQRFGEWWQGFWGVCSVG